ncbi:M28 family peptidase [Dactylosporangium sp. AC04546]|uniref:M28 family peptidase n=1 Tax=Dactylosporangium sp. AC04546 TaxID=2862460 RepID=UPI001EDE60DE|nr:M28 family peptidase [Dactylosporangium sp. AC04546]WVK82394.1 M28 family peptidase [Dactylosporangium sp. AC04546]
MSDRSFAAPPRRPLVAAAAVAVLALLAFLGIADVQPPSPRPASAPAGDFSAGRAFTHVQRIGQEVHATGSPANDRVREYLVETLTGLGLRPEVQDTVGVNAGKFGDGGMAHVRNVVAVLPGSASTGQVVLMAHYDSVQVSFGANDDGAGTSTLLEVARALTTGERPRNDVVFLFTDAEEACLCGAEAFVSRHPLGQKPSVVLNFEARGSSGPAVMFQTSVGNADLIDVYARTPHPVGTSLAVEVYRLLSNDTDFTPFLGQSRFTGLNTAYIDGSSVYHSPFDRPSTMHRSSLQHHGDNALALARAFGGADLPPLMKPASGDAVYFPFAGLLLRYPSALTWPIAALALVAVAALVFLARRRGLTSVPRTLAGLGLALVPVIVVAVAAQLLWALLVAIRPGYGELLDPARPTWFRFGVVALTASVLLAWYALSRRRLGPVPLATGGLALLAVLGLVFAAAIPGGSYLVAIPALAGALAGIAALFVPHHVVKVAVLTAGAGVATLILAPTVALFFPALGLATGAAPALFAMLLGLAVLPVLEPLFRPAGEPRHRLLGSAPAAAALVLALVCTTVGMVVDRWDAGHPEPTHLMYALDRDTGTAEWVSLEQSPGDWTSGYVRNHQSLNRQFPVLPEGMLSVGPAQTADLPAPVVTTIPDSGSGSASGGRRTVRFRIESKRTVRFISFYGDVGDHRVVKATVEGRDAVTYLPDQDRFGVVFHAPPADGIEVELVLSDAAPFTLRVVDGSDGLTALPGFTPRPATVGVFGSHSSELVAVARTTQV